MPVYDLYSKRRARESGQTTDVFTYNEIPEGLRIQIVHIWGDAIGVPYVTPGPDGTGQKIRSIYMQIVKILRREYRVFNLLQTKRDPNDEQYAFDELKQWFLRESNTDRVLDAIEITARTIERVCSSHGYISPRRNNAEICKDALVELNVRFKESGVGYQYEDGNIIRVDSQLIHTEAVIPALTVLRDPAFKNAQEEFLGAYEHFRHGNKEEALVDCCKCFESTMKVICTKRSWPYDPNRATVSDLVRILFDNGLVPPYWQTHMGGLRSILESAISTPRNRQGGHGAGAAPAPVIPDELISYVLHMTASTVLFLAEAEKSLP